VLALLIGVNLNGYFNRSSTLSLESYELRFKMAIAAKSMSSLAGAALGDGGATADSLAEIEKGVQELRATDAEADALYAAAKVARTGKPLPAKEVPLLAAKSGPRYDGLRSALLLPKPSAEWAKKVIPHLGTGAVDAFAKTRLNSYAGIREPKVTPSTIRVLLSGLMIVGVLGLGCLTLVLGLAWLKGAGPAAGFGVGPLDLPKADGLALLGALQLLTFILASVLGVMVASALPRGFEAVANFVPYLLMVAGLTWLSLTKLRGRRISFADLGFRRFEARYLGWGVGGAFANAPIVLLFGYLGTRIFSFRPPPGNRLPVDFQGGTGKIGKLIGIFLIASLFAPFLEETMFRGTLAPAFARVRGSAWAGILISSFFFASIHPTGIPAWPALMAVGSMGAFLAYRTGSLWPSVIMHAVHNFGTLVLALLAS